MKQFSVPIPSPVEVLTSDGQTLTVHEVRPGDRIMIRGRLHQVRVVDGQNVYGTPVPDISELPWPVRTGLRILAAIAGVKV